MERPRGLCYHPAGPTRSRCADAARLVSRYLEGELDAEACARLEAHVKGCADCGAACETLRNALVMCGSWRGEKLPGQIRTSLKQAVRQMITETRKRA